MSLSNFTNIEICKDFFVSREIASRKNFFDIVNCSEKKSTSSPDVYWEKCVYSPGNTPEALDFENRLIRRTSGTKTITMSYDGDGNRVSKTVSDSTSGTTTTYYLVDTNNLTGYAQVVEELYNNGGNLETYRSYTYGLDLIAQHQLMPPVNPTQWETSYYMYDGLGTVRALTDDNGLITDAYTYSAFGELLNTQSSGTATPNTHLFTGEQFDSDLGMYFLRARYMNPEKGRFHNMDPFEGFRSDPITLHKYAYANLNPILFVDPTGNFGIIEAAAAIAIVGVIAHLTYQGVKSILDGQRRDGLPEEIRCKFNTFQGVNSITFGAVSGGLSIATIITVAAIFSNPVTAIAGVFVVAGGLYAATNLALATTSVASGVNQIANCQDEFGNPPPPSVVAPIFNFAAVHAEATAVDFSKMIAKETGKAYGRAAFEETRKQIFGQEQEDDN